MPFDDYGFQVALARAHDRWLNPPEPSYCQTRRCGEVLTDEDVQGSEYLSKRLGARVRLCGPCLEKQEEIRQEFGGE